MKDKHNLLGALSPSSRAALEIGVGDLKRNAGAIGIDILDSPAVDVIGDALTVLRTLPERSISSIYSEHAFEHMPNVTDLIAEAERVLMDDGKMVVVVPHFSNPFFYSDPTHLNFFGLYTFSYYCEDRLFKRKVPRYVAHPNLELASVRLVFKTFPPRYLTYLWRKVLQLIFNSSYWMREVYEDSFSRFISCYEIEYIIRKKGES